MWSVFSFGKLVVNSVLSKNGFIIGHVRFVKIVQPKSLQDYRLNFALESVEKCFFQFVKNDPKMNKDHLKDLKKLRKTFFNDF